MFNVNLAQIRSVVLEILHTQTKKSQGQRQKQNLTQLTACGKEKPQIIHNVSGDRSKTAKYQKIAKGDYYSAAR